MDFNITEFDIRKKFSDSDLRAVIDYHLKNAESDFLDFKELPTEQEKKEKFYRDLPKDIQAFANNGGGILIIGVRQKPKNNESPIIGIQNYDTLVNNISQRQTLLRIQLLSVKIDYDGKEIVFVFIPSPEEAIEYKNNYIRRSGTVNVPLTEPNEIDKLKAEVLAREKGFTIITKLKELIPVYLTWIVNNRIPGYENFINRLLKIIHETNALTFKIFLFVVAKETKRLEKRYDALENNQIESFTPEIMFKGSLLIFIVLIITQFFIIVFNGYNPFSFFEALLDQGNVNYIYLGNFPIFLTIIILFAVAIYFIAFISILPKNKQKNIIDKKEIDEKILEFHNPPLPTLSALEHTIKSLNNDKNVNLAINDVVFPVSYFIFQKSYNISIKEKYSYNNIDFQYDPIQDIKEIPYQNEFIEWIKNQSYIEEIKEGPSQEMVKAIRYVAFKIAFFGKDITGIVYQFNLSSSLVKDIEQEQSQTRMIAFQYLLMYQLFFSDFKELQQN